MSYNLDEDVAEYFEFTVGGHEYQMRYPTTEEIMAAQELDEAKQLDWMYGYIGAKTEGAPAIKDVVGKMNVKKLQLFNKMVKAEFSGEA